MSRWMLLALAACAPPPDPPENPAHDEVEHGVAHARGLEVPFLCRDPSGAGYGPCPEALRPERANLSCDASGCHGDHTFDPTTEPDARHLRGSDGPSCWSCHDQEWSAQKGGRSNGDD